MRCVSIGYNQSIYYQQPVFRAKPIKINWSSESGQKIEKTLALLATLAVASVSCAKAHPEEQEDDYIAELSDFNWDKQELFNHFKTSLEKSYKATKDPQILEKHVHLTKDAYDNKDLLRGSFPELSQEEFAHNLMSESTVETLGLLDLGVLKSALSLDMGGFRKFCDDVSVLISMLTKPRLEVLKMKFNPQNTIEYRNLEEDVKKYKRNINRLLGEDNNLKRKKLLVQIEELKGDKGNIKQIKELKSRVQDLYKNCENASEISEIMKQIAEKQIKMKNILNQKINMSPQEVINKVWTIAAVAQSPYYKKDAVGIPKEYCDEEFMKQLNAVFSDDGDVFTISRETFKEIFGGDADLQFLTKRRLLNKDLKELIDLIQPASGTNDSAWSKVINKKLYERSGLKYNEKIANKLDLANCKYLNELIVSDDSFWRYMPALLKGLSLCLKINENMTIGDALDRFQHNIHTKNKFKRRKIDYNKWVGYDENSYIQDTVTINAKDAQFKALKNLIFDIATLYYAVPKEEFMKIYNALKEIGAEIVMTDEYIDIDVDGREIVFDELEPVMSVIKYELNNNDFWSTENPDEKIENARDFLYCHFMLQRKREIDCAGKLKGSEVHDIKVRKVNMADIKYSLCLGNHSHCCTALGSQSNEWSAPAYILNRCISAIEVLANGEPVGNTMIYLADVNGELSLVLDDIELQTKFQNNEKIRDMIIKYAKQICSEIGKPNIPIYAGPGMHKIDLSDYPVIEDAQMVIIGESIKQGGVYLDFDNDYHDIGNIKEMTNLYKIA